MDQDALFGNKLMNGSGLPTYSLLPYIRRCWSRLLAREQLRIHTQQSLDSPSTRFEIFVGDEFLRDGKMHIDIVIRPCRDETGYAAVPAVLVFTKHARRLMAQELNGLCLETKVVCDDALWMHKGASRNITSSPPASGRPFRHVPSECGQVYA